jgi:hypothetical protein
MRAMKGELRFFAQAGLKSAGTLPMLIVHLFVNRDRL